MSEAGQELGFVVIDIKASTIRMLKMDLCENFQKQNAQTLLNVDSMMRAAASYGATVGAYRIESFVDEYKEYFCRVGFI